MLKLTCCVTFFILLISVGYAENDIQDSDRAFGVADNIRELLNQFKDRMCHPIAKFKLPALDPFQLEHIDFSIDNSLAQISGSVSGLQVDGLSDIDFEKITFSALSLKFSFTIVIPKVSLKGNFKAKGVIGELFPIDGDGKFDLSVEEIKLEAHGKFKYANSMYIAELKAEPSITKLNAKIENLVPNKDVNDFINKALNKIGPDLLSGFWKDFGEDIILEIEKLSKDLLKDLTVGKLMEIVNGKNPIFDENDPEPNCKKND